MAVSSWLADPDTWDTATIGGIELPGVCRVKCKRARAIDVKKSAGGDGGTTTDQGYDPADVTVTVTIWTEEQWVLMTAILPRLEAEPGKAKAAPVSIAHPITYLRRVKACMIKDIEGPVGEGPGARVFTINAIEWRPPKASGAKAAPTTPQAVVDQREKMLAAESKAARMQYEHDHADPGYLYTENGKVGKIPGYLQPYLASK